MEVISVTFKTVSRLHQGEFVIGQKVKIINNKTYCGDIGFIANKYENPSLLYKVRFADGKSGLFHQDKLENESN